MSSITIQQRIRDFNRLRQIVAVIFEEGGGIFIEKARLNYLVPWSCRIHCFFKPRAKEQCLVQMRGEQKWGQPPFNAPDKCDSAVLFPNSGALGQNSNIFQE